MEPTPSKSPFQFSLRKLLLFTLLAACLLGISRLFPDEMFARAIAVEVLAIALVVNIGVLVALERSRNRRR
jgi:hypothetical protein